MISPSPTKILIGISLNADVSKQLLSLAIQLAARPNDTIVAFHALVTANKKSSKKVESTKKISDRTKLRLTRAFIISILGEYTQVCQSKQVHLEAKVGTSTSVVKGLIDEATSMGATFLIVGGGSNNQNPLSYRSALEISKSCLEHAPEGCSVLSIRRAQRSLELETAVPPIHEFRRSSSRWSLRRHFGTKSIIINQNQAKFPTESIWEKPSPRAVLDGPEQEIISEIEEDDSSLGYSSISGSPPLSQTARGRSNIWKNLTSFRHVLPFRRPSFDGSKSCSHRENQPPSSSKCFSYDEISNATNDFHPDNMVGQGGYSEVYKGDLKDGRTIAVKRLSKDNTNEIKQKEFLIELGVLGHVNHPNTIHLIGCCIENGLHLVFNFSPNGSLESALHGGGCDILDWSVRRKIAVGVARGLHYLHKGCKHRIIHRDIKASNVLLGSNFEPQISDFGLAKWLPKDWNHYSAIPVEGSFGYLAPEYFMRGIVDEKTDVFAFGILLLEIITGRMPVDSSKKNLLAWARPLIESEDIAVLADPKLDGNYDVDQMYKLVLIASYCVRRSSLWRPSMDEVFQLLMDDEVQSGVVKSWGMSDYVVDEVDDYSNIDIDKLFPANQSFLDDC
ncbi:probable receptor-like serine/threonine-protein kinase At5g57670 isoform X1 [Papaver somniferum]|uniref:probable receptor-like serine/threonine-protein kinase At5g57670 isoform X1 n=1 Tax=Papaver somniferum TaxID=3469 RepID=UPI000E6FD478|nr:probable receptor-like serine/threonine-protein kinase At5g57670 isoform X1 [Papaver somniferum]